MRRQFRKRGVRWWFLFGERVRLGIADHRLLDAEFRAEGMTPPACGRWPWTDRREFHRLHVGAYCLRWRGRPKNLAIPEPDPEASS